MPYAKTGAVISNTGTGYGDPLYEVMAQIGTNLPFTSQI